MHLKVTTCHFILMNCVDDFFVNCLSCIYPFLVNADILFCLFSSLSLISHVYSSNKQTISYQHQYHSSCYPHHHCNHVGMFLFPLGDNTRMMMVMVCWYIMSSKCGKNINYMYIFQGKVSGLKAQMGLVSATVTVLDPQTARWQIHSLGVIWINKDDIIIGKSTYKGNVLVKEDMKWKSGWEMTSSLPPIRPEVILPIKGFA